MREPQQEKPDVFLGDQCISGLNSAAFEPNLAFLKLSSRASTSEQCF